jgi:hypothetical protein
VRSDSNGRETWYGSWRVGGRRIKRRIGLKRRASTAEGLTRTQAEAELRRLMGTEVVLAGPQRNTIEEAGALYVEHSSTSWSASARRWPLRAASATQEGRTEKSFAAWAALSRGSRRSMGLTSRLSCLAIVISGSVDFSLVD